MELKQYINILRRRMWVIITTLLLTMVTVVLGTHLQTPVYESSTTLRIATSAGSQLSYQDYQYADRLMNTYIEIATSKPVMEELIKRLNLIKPPTVKAVKVTNTELIKLTVEETNPSKVATEVNTLANILITQTRELYTGGVISSSEILGKQLAIAKYGVDSEQQKYQKLLIQTPAVPEEIAVALQALNLQQSTYATLLSQYEQAKIRETMQANMVTIVEPGLIPMEPSKPRPIMNYALGFIAGLVGGALLALIFENLDTRLYTMEDIESITELTALTKIPKAKRKQIDLSRNGTTQFAEAFRNLATKIQLMDHQQSNQVLLIVSAEPRQGKSMIVTNLAYALAETGKKVVAVDCDMRLPRLHGLFGLTNQYGLSDVLGRKTSLLKSLQKCQFKGVTVLTSGSPVDHPSKVLGSPGMVELINKLCQRFDYVLMDSPALLSFADAEILAPNANGLILVERRTYAKRDAVQRVVKFLAGYKKNLVGLVVNQADNVKDYGYYEYPRRLYRQTNREKRSFLKDIESVTKLTALTKVPKATKKQINISQNGTSPFAEAFRNLATQIQLMDHQHPNKVLLVMSAEPRQGKSMIVTNLALALAETGKKVVAVDCDVRVPRLHRLFALPNQYGLSDVLEHKVSLLQSLQESQSKNVTLLTSGSPIDHHSKVLASPAMAELVDKLSQKFDYVVLDTPALLSFAGTEILASDVNCLILVVQKADVKRESLQLVNKSIAGFRNQSIGLIINQVDNNNFGNDKYSGKPNGRTSGENKSLIERANTQIGNLNRLVRRKRL